ncbi:AbiH family protein [Prevotellamassilia timonensis]|uniref:AbiH family protein n=1 Tax=Prevotellamassilia timonensis TaxID=1852370 RepID=UPI003A91176A
MTENTKNEVASLIMNAAKPTDEIIKKNKSILEKLNEVNKLCIYGLSFSSVDEPYLIVLFHL